MRSTERKRVDYLLYRKPTVCSRSSKPRTTTTRIERGHGPGAGVCRDRWMCRSSTRPTATASWNMTGRLTGGPVERELGLDEFPVAGGAVGSLHHSDRHGPSGGVVAGRISSTIAMDERRAITSRWRSTARCEAIAKGQKRILLVMATGTGKTYTAFQIMWRLWKAKKGEAHPVPGRPQYPGRSDHDQRLQALRRCDDQDHRPRRWINPSRFIWRCTRRFQARRSGMNIYKQFSPDFFDLIFVDECHRGSAAEDSAWREILEYFCVGHADWLDGHARRKRTTFPISITLANRFTPIRSSRASKTASWRPTR